MMLIHWRTLRLIAIACSVLWPGVGAAQTTPPAPQSGPPQPPPVFKIEVIETTPLPGLNLKPDQIPAPVQTATRKDFDDSGANAGGHRMAVP